MPTQYLPYLMFTALQTIFKYPMTFSEFHSYFFPTCLPLLLLFPVSGMFCLPHLHLYKYKLSFKINQKCYLLFQTLPDLLNQLWFFEIPRNCLLLYFAFIWFYFVLKPSRKFAFMAGILYSSPVNSPKDPPLYFPLTRHLQNIQLDNNVLAIMRFF